MQVSSLQLIAILFFYSFSNLPLSVFFPSPFAFSLSLSFSFSLVDMKCKSSSASKDANDVHVDEYDQSSLDNDNWDGRRHDSTNLSSSKGTNFATTSGAAIGGAGYIPPMITGYILPMPTMESQRAHVVGLRTYPELHDPYYLTHTTNNVDSKVGGGIPCSDRWCAWHTWTKNKRVNTGNTSQ